MVEDSKKPTACQFGVRITSSVQGRSGEEKLFPSKGNIVIGRSKNCQIVLSDPSVSRQHAKLELVSNGLKIVDMETNNGVWVDKERVNEKLLFAGDQFRIGMTTFTVFSVEDKSSVTREDFEKDESVFDETVFMPVSSDIYPDHKWFEEEGELTVIKAHQPFLIDDPDARLGSTLEEATTPFQLDKPACYTCWLHGAICSNYGGIGQDVS